MEVIENLCNLGRRTRRTWGTTGQTERSRPVVRNNPVRGNHGTDGTFPPAKRRTRTARSLHPNFSKESGRNQEQPACFRTGPAGLTENSSTTTRPTASARPPKAHARQTIGEPQPLSFPSPLPSKRIGPNRPHQLLAITRPAHPSQLRPRFNQPRL